MITRIFLNGASDKEVCFNVETDTELTQKEQEVLFRFLAQGFNVSQMSLNPFLDISEEKGVEIGPRLSFATPFSTNVVSGCKNSGITKVIRVERSYRYLTDNVNLVVSEKCDRMTEEVYEKPPNTFILDQQVQPVRIIPLIEDGISAFDTIKGLSFTDQDKRIYYDIFVNQEKRNPTDVELFDLLNSNCEHSRHGWFNARMIIDGEEQELSAFDLVKRTLAMSPDRSVIGFHDNSSSIRGHVTYTLMPEFPGQSSGFIPNQIDWDITLTGETHNFPTGIASYPGAETGTGGRLRDGMATGKGSYIIAGTGGYCISSLLISGYPIPGENPDFKTPANMANGLKVKVEGSNGLSDYGNRFGEPLILGFSRNFYQNVGDDTFGFVKPILFTAGIGQMQNCHSEKGHATKNLKIVQIGGPAYRVGFGGGAASSQHQGENSAKLDFDAVQRGDGEMAKKVYNVIRACNDMGINTPIVSIHDQGAGGPANVLKEIVEESGGKVYIRKINSGDPSMSILELWVCEYQERNGLLIPEDRIEEFKTICAREKVPCEVLGYVTGDGRFVVEDDDGSTPVDFDLKKILKDFPTSTYEDRRRVVNFTPLSIPKDLTVTKALQDVFKLLAVGSKEYLIHKVDRSVGGFIARQQAVGPLGLPLSNVGVVALSHIELKGGATSIGEKANLLLLNPKAGARMATAEMLLNMACTKITDLCHIKSSVNWMWAPKKEGEGAALYDAVSALTQCFIDLGIGIDGGKDSLSMAASVDGKDVKSRQVVVSGYGPVDDITEVLTPDIKYPGETILLHVDLSEDQARLGGSAFAQSLGNLGVETPDLDIPKDLVIAFKLIQSLISSGVISSYHDVSDGGLITTLCEMAMAGNCGLKVDFSTENQTIDKLFAEELGFVIEVSEDNLDELSVLISETGLYVKVIGATTEDKVVSITINNKEELLESTDTIKRWWSETSYQLEKCQKNKCADEERRNTLSLQNPLYKLTFDPRETSKEIIESQDRFKVAVIREEGSNGEKEMISALYLAGFSPIDVTMTDLLEGRVNLADFRGVVFVGGFSYADYPESAKGWAMTIIEHPKLKEMFEDFRARKDTWSYGVCNGCQMVALLGWTVPGLSESARPVFTRNMSGKFESRYPSVLIPENNKSIMFKGMEGSILPICNAHAEGRISASPELLRSLKEDGRVPMLYVDYTGEETQDYPFNPNGSPFAIAGLTSPDGRHTITMPHPERLFKPWQFQWLPEKMQKLQVSPWLKIFQNMREWCE